MRAMAAVRLLAAALLAVIMVATAAEARPVVKPPPPPGPLTAPRGAPLPPRTMEEVVRALRDAIARPAATPPPACGQEHTFPPGPDGQYFRVERAGDQALRWRLVLGDHPLQWIPTFENYEVRVGVGGRTVDRASWSWGDDPEGVVKVHPGAVVELFAAGIGRSGHVIPAAWTAAAGTCVAGPASATHGRIDYGPIDPGTGQRSTARAVITPTMIAEARNRRIGSSASPSIRPPGWDATDPANRARGHLVGRQFGGSGRDPANLVTMAQNAANSPVMSGFEDLIAATVEAGQTVTYEVTPLYPSPDHVGRPATIRLRAVGDRGFRLHVVISNTAAAGVTVYEATPELPFDL